MKDKFTKFIISCVILGILAVTAIFGMIIFQEISRVLQTGTIPEVENFKTVIVQQDNEPKETNTQAGRANLEGINEINTNTSGSIGLQKNTSTANYFYNQLEEPSKVIYEALQKNKENMKTGTYKVELGNSFSQILDQPNGQDELGKYYQSAIEAYNYDNPEVFYLDSNKMYLNIETTTKGNQRTYEVYINSGEESSYLIDEFNNKGQIDDAITKIRGIRNQIKNRATGNKLEDIKMVHDYLVDNISYDSSLQQPNIYNIYGALVNGISVCEGYARSMKYLLEEIGIPCTLVIGKGKNAEGKTENHAWNYVQLDNNWYAVDATWDDPIITGGGWLTQSAKYKYFLKGETEFNQNHIPSGQFTPNGKIFIYPELSKRNAE